MYLSSITVAYISRSFTDKMAAKINWHRYGTNYVTATLCIHIRKNVIGVILWVGTEAGHLQTARPGPMRTRAERR